MIARRIATERARKKEVVFDPEITALEEKFAESLGNLLLIFLHIALILADE